MATSATKTGDWERRLGLDDETSARLAEVAAREDRSIASIIRRALIVYLKHAA